METMVYQRDMILGVFQDVAGDLQVIAKLFDIISQSPEVITKELLSKTKSKVGNIIQKVNEAQTVITTGSAKSNEPQSESQFPVTILEGVVTKYDRQLNTQMTLYADEIRALKLSDRDFESVLHTLFDSAIKTQDGIYRKTCEVSVASKSDTMVLRFKDFGRSIPREELESMFDGSKISHEHGGGYGYYRMRQILNRVGGRVSIDSDRTKFTTITIVIPFQ